jgi:hypothetical protein
MGGHGKTAVEPGPPGTLREAGALQMSAKLAVLTTAIVAQRRRGHEKVVTEVGAVAADGLRQRRTKQARISYSCLHALDAPPACALATLRVER